MADIPHAVPRILGYLGRSHIWDTEIPAVHLALCSHSMFNAYVDLIHGRTDFFVERSYYELAQQHEMPVLRIMLYLGRRHLSEREISAARLALCSRSLFKRYQDFINDLALDVDYYSYLRQSPWLYIPDDAHVRGRF